MNNSESSIAEDEYQHLFKLILIGDQAVGKTCIVNRYTKDEMPDTSFPTIGVEFQSKVIIIEDGIRIKIQLWDTAGQERYKAIASTHYRRAFGALVVYDITNRKSFESVRTWLNELQQQADNDIVIFIIGNKLDIVMESPEKRQVSRDEGENFAKENNYFFRETSASKNIGIADCFKDAVTRIYQVRQNILESDENLKLIRSQLIPKLDGNKSCC